MKFQWFFALLLGCALTWGAPQSSFAQSSQGTERGSTPGNSGVSGGGVKNTTANNSPGTQGSAPETSLSRPGAGEPATREGDVPNQIGALVPVAFLMFLILAGGLYFFVFRKSTTPEGDAAANGTNTR